MEDLNPPSTFLVSLDAAADGFATDASAFFGSGGIDSPVGIVSQTERRSQHRPVLRAHFCLNAVSNCVLKKAGRCAFSMDIRRRDSRCNGLVTKYKADPMQLWAHSSAAWKGDGVRFSVPGDPWVERETSWHNYYLRSNLTYDSFFREHILSQGHVYQYIMGFQGAARDPLQHALPFIFSNPEDCSRGHALHAEGNPAGWFHSLWHRGKRRTHASHLSSQ